MKISLIIAAYNQRAALTKLFQGLALQTDWPEEILIADDGSTDGTQELIEDWRRTVAVPVRHHWQSNNGFGKLAILNKAVAAATGDYLVFTDGDCVPHRRFIADHRALAERGWWVQGRRCFVREEFVRDFVPGRTPVWQWVLRRRISRPYKSLRLPWPVIYRDQEQRGIIGCNMAFWRDDVLAVNGFDEAYSGRGMGADSDLGSRIYNLGRRRKFVYGRALVYHLDHPVSARTHHAENKARLEEVIRSGKTRSERGVDRYLVKG